MISPLNRRRLLGALVAIFAFGAGVLVGARWQRTRPPASGIIVTATNQIPEELERLSPSEAQRAQLRLILARGRDRVLRVVDDFTPRMQAAMDSTDAEIRSILDVRQLAEFDSVRRANPPLRRVFRQKND